MSSPSIPVVSPADLDEVVVYDSGGEEFECWHHASVRDWSQSSVVVVVDFPGVPKRTKFCPALPKEGSMGWSAEKAGLSQGGREKGASSAVIHGKRQASPPSGAGPSKKPCEHESSAGPPESFLFSPTPGVPSERLSSPPAPIPSITEVFLCKQVEALTTSLAVREGKLQQAREDCDVAQTEKDAMEWEKEHFGARGDGVSVRGVGLAGASDADGGAAHGGGTGAGTSSGGGCAVGGAGGGEVEGGLVGQQGRFGAHRNPS
ncbi:hypothetical protein C0989_008280, partial [Termitomyces sp. Mn162]